VCKKKASEIDAAEAARLFQTRGVPPELTSELAAEAGLGFDWTKFDAEMDAHGKASGTLVDGVMGNSGPIDEFKNKLKKTTFTGYDVTSASASILGIGNAETTLDEIDASSGQCVVVLSETPFYARSGGQESDFGTLKNDQCEFQVTEMEKSGDLFVHQGSIISGKLKVGDTVTATVDTDRRSAVCRAHSATHILHYALQQNLGQHATQRGSRVDDDKLRFDFANQGAVSSEQLAAIEAMALEKISQGVDVKWETVSLDDAKSAGAMMLFGEKYPDPVRMVSIGEFSKELCGGTHLTNSSDVMAFEIVSESGTAAGTRRIEALTGQRAIENQQQVRDASQKIAQLLSVDVSQVGSAVELLSGEVRDLKKQAASGKQGQGKDRPELPAAKPDANYFEIRNGLFAAASLLNASTADLASRVESLLSDKKSFEQQIEKLAGAAQLSAEDLISGGTKKGDVLVIAKSLPLATPDLMRQLIDQIRKKTNPVAVFFATSPSPDKVLLIAGLSRDLVERGIKAGDWIKTVAPIVGGGGGGKPDLAQAGGKNPEKIEQALTEAVTFIESKI